MRILKIKVDGKIYAPTKINRQNKTDGCYGCELKQESPCEFSDLCERFIPKSKVWEEECL